MTHEIKSHPGVFELRWRGFKPWECRSNDRNYNVGDYLHEREFDPKEGKHGKYTGRSIISYVACIVRHDYGIPKKYVIMTVVTIGHGSIDYNNPLAPPMTRQSEKKGGESV